MECIARMTATLKVMGDKADAEASVLFDTGASESFVRRELAEKITTLVRLPRPLSFTLADNRKIEVTMTAVLAVEVAGQIVLDTFMVLDGGLADVILGESTMRKFGLKIDLERSEIFFALKEDKMEEFLKKLLTAIGVSAADDVTEDKAIELVKGKVQSAQGEAPKIVAAPAILQALDLGESATEAEVKGKILALKNPGNVVKREEHEQLLARMREQEIEQAVNNAITVDGKLYPHEREWALAEAKKDLPAFKAFVQNRPKVLPIGSRLPEHKDNPAQKIDEVQAAINRQLGLSQETFLKYNS